MTSKPDTESEDFFKHIKMDIHIYVHNCRIKGKPRLSALYIREIIIIIVIIRMWHALLIRMRNTWLCYQKVRDTIWYITCDVMHM